MRYCVKCISILALISHIAACGGGGEKTFAQDADEKPVTPAPTPTPPPTPTPTPTPSPTPSPTLPNVHYVNGQVLIMWDAPTQRENGAEMQPNEVGGYEVRFRKQEDPDYVYLVQAADAGNAVIFNYLEGYYEFQVAVYDTNGLYSRFIPLTPQ